MADLMKTLKSWYTPGMKKFIAVVSIGVVSWFVLSVYLGLPKLPFWVTDPFIDHLNLLCVNAVLALWSIYQIYDHQL